MSDKKNERLEKAFSTGLPKVNAKVEGIEVKRPKTGISQAPKTQIQGASTTPKVPVPPKPSGMTHKMNNMPDGTVNPLQKADYESSDLPKAKDKNHLASQDYRTKLLLYIYKHHDTKKLSPMEKINLRDQHIDNQAKQLEKAEPDPLKYGLPPVKTEDIIKPKTPPQTPGTLDYSQFNRPTYSTSGKTKPIHNPVQHSKGALTGTEKVLHKANPDDKNLVNKVRDYEQKQQHYYENVPIPRNPQHLLSPEYEQQLSHYVSNHPFSQYNWNPLGQQREVDNLRYQQWKQNNPEIKTFKDRQAAYNQALMQGKQSMQKAEKDPKFERCVMHVKDQNKAEGLSTEDKNPWAICHASLNKNENECDTQEYIAKTEKMEPMPYERLAKLRKCMASKLNKADPSGKNPMPVFMRE